MFDIKVGPLSERFSWGSVVTGLGWDSLAREDVRQRLRDLFEERGFIVFEGVEPSAKMQVAISEVFGPLKDHPTKTVARVDDPDAAIGVIDMHSLPRDISDGNLAGLIEKGGKVLTRYSPWHFDHCYNDELNLAGVLRVVKNSPSGGRTGFVDGIELYRQLSPELREQIEGLNVIYTLDTRLSQMKFGRDFKDFGDRPNKGSSIYEAQEFPRALHPAVWTRPTAEKVLHVGPWMAVGIEGREDAEGDALLEAVCQEVNAKANAYWHDWRTDDMIIWDNRRMLHAVEGNDPIYERQSQRTTIRGDYGLGYFEGGKKVGEVERKIAAL
jgi:taurine dioxygenase